jgi:RHS repeat-associated protein
VKSITYPDGEVLPYTYDSAGRMLTAGTYVKSATYDARGNPKTRLLGNNVQDGWNYDPDRFWLTNVNASYLGATFYNIAFGHNVRGEVTSRSNGTVAQKDNWAYGYDDLRRLTVATNSANSAWTQNFTYDALGRITSQTGIGAYTYPALGTGPQHAPATVGGSPHEYDGNGNLIYGSGDNIYYDRLNRPTTVNGVTMAYDADGVRIKEGNTVFISNLYEVDTSLSPGVSTNYIFFNNALVARKRAATVTYYHGDLLGSVGMMTNSSGAAVLRKTYAPFGKVLLTTGTLTDSFGLAGQRLDPTGLYHMGAREMAPGLGMFVTPDPSNAPNAEHPQTLNKYAYANNSPTYLYDPTGYAAQDAKDAPVLPISEEQYRKDIYSFWKNIPISTGYTNDKQVAAAGKRAQQEAASGTNDVESNPAQRAFLNRVARPTFIAQDQLNSRSATPTEFFLQLSDDQNGAVQILGAARIPQGGRFDLVPGTIFVAHWHYVGLERRPGSGDNSAPRSSGIASLVVTPDARDGCCNMFEVGRQNTAYMFRNIRGETPGEWKADDRWKPQEQSE